MRNNPNAAVAGGSGVVATLIAGTLSLAGFDLDPVYSVAVASAATTVLLLVGRVGFKGLARRIWQGSGE